MFLIVGLGNPGPRYQNTRHNAGFLLVDRLAERQGGIFRRDSKRALVCRTRWGERALFLAKPQTFMNLSGQAVRELLERLELEPSQLLVVYDEAALPLGKIRLRLNGSAGGHKGMQSILACLGTLEIARLRIGIAPPEAPEDLSDFVLSEFGKREWEEFQQVLDRAAEAVTTFLEEGPEQAMARYN